MRYHCCFIFTYIFSFCAHYSPSSSSQLLVDLLLASITAVAHLLDEFRRSLRSESGLGVMILTFTLGYFILPVLIIEGCHSGADLDLSPLPTILFSFIDIALLSLIKLNAVEIYLELHDVVILAPSKWPHIVLHCFQLSMVVMANSFDDVGVLTERRKLGSISGITLNIVCPVWIVLIEALYLKVTVFRVF